MKRLPPPGLAALTALALVTACADQTGTSTIGPTADPVSAPVAGAVAVPTAAIPTNTWVTRADLLRKVRYGATSATLTNTAGRAILYVIGGATTDAQDSFVDEALTTVQAYNTATDTWTNRAPLPIPIYRPNTAAVIGGRIYLSGGRLGGEKHYLARLYVYDASANTWTRKRDMPAATFGGITGVFGGRLYVLACTIEDECSDFEPVTAFRYDPATDQWTTLSTSPVPVSDFVMGGAIGGKLYAVGGAGGNLVVYDPATDTWATRAPLPGGFRWDAASLAFNARLYLIGGRQVMPDGRVRNVRTVSVYDSGTNTWSTKAPLPTDRYGVTASRVVVGGQSRIEVVGGLRPGNNLQLAP